jgi:hypothetical protein
MLLVPAGLAQHDETRVKAALIYNIARFVQWPADPRTDADAPLVIAVIGSDRAASALERTVDGRRVHDRRIRVLRSAPAAEDPPPHILYLAQSHDAGAARLIERFADHPTLVISDDPKSCRLGATLCFFRERQRVRIVVDDDAAAASGLSISSQLLKLARPIAQVERDGP